MSIEAAKPLDVTELTNLINRYTNSQKTPKHEDPMESGTITPSLIAEQRSLEDIRKYEYKDDQGNVICQIDRYILPFSIGDKKANNDELLRQEKEVFEAALQANKNVILVDMFKTDSNLQIDGREKGKPEFHTICLWIKSESVVMYDPSDIALTFERIRDIFKAISMRLPLKPGLFFKKKDVKKKDKKQVIRNSDLNQMRFYGPFKGEAGHPLGRGVGDQRDCIDIAVKIGFMLIEAQKRSTVKLDEEIKLLSNQARFNPHLKGACNGTYIRGLQSGHQEIRKGILHLLEKNKDICRYVVVHSFEDLKKIETSRDSFNQIISEGEDFLKMIKRVSLDKFEKLKELHDIIQEFNENNSMMTEVTVKLGPDFKTFIPLEGSEYNHTKLHLAVINKKQIQPILAEWVSSKGKKMSQKLIGWADIYGQTALYLAAHNGDKEACNLLLDQMTIPQILARTYGIKLTALHIAARCGHEEVVTMLLKHKNGGNGLADAVDIDGRTALHWAVWAENLNICKELCEVMSEDAIYLKAGGLTVLHCAIDTQNKDIISLLISDKKFGKKLIDIPNAFGMEPAKYAEFKESKEIIEMLESCQEACLD